MRNKKSGIQVMEKNKLVWFKCSCGKDKFTITKTYIEPGIGEVEEFFTCDCGKSYHWAYGLVDIVDEV